MQRLDLVNDSTWVDVRFVIATDDDGDRPVRGRVTSARVGVGVGVGVGGAQPAGATGPAAVAVDPTLVTR